MGTTYSLKSDFNRVLAKQPRTLVPIPGVEAARTIQQKPLTIPLVIPDLIPPQARKSEQNAEESANINQSPSESRIPLQNQSQSPFNNNSFLSPIFSNNSNEELLTQRNLQNRFEEPGVPQRSSSFSVTTELPETRMSMQDDISIISRSIINSQNESRSHSRGIQSIAPTKSVIERNGKKYLMEYHERAEKRIVQWYDPSLGRIRFFEVIDYIPSKIVRPYSQFGSPRPLDRTVLLTGQPKQTVPHSQNSTTALPQTNMPYLFDQIIKAPSETSRSSVSSHSTSRLSTRSNAGISSHIRNRGLPTAVPTTLPRRNSHDKDQNNTNIRSELLNQLRTSRGSQDDESTSSNDTIQAPNQKIQNPPSVGSLSVASSPYYGVGEESKNTLNPDLRRQSYQTQEGDTGRISIDPFAKPHNRGTYYSPRRLNKTYTEPLNADVQNKQYGKSDYTPISTNFNVKYQ